MRIVIAPDKFKGSLSAAEAAEAMERGVRAVWPEAEVVRCPVADGGEGTARALCDALGGEWVVREVEGPLGEPVSAGYAWMAAEGLAVVEMSEASGLALVPPERRQPMRATTYGTGQLIRDAVERGARRVMVGLGGSATTDGGVGMAAALGVRFSTAEGLLARPAPEDFPRLTRIDVSERLALPEVIGASDVQNPLCGDRGAARLFSPQKGAGPEEVEQLEGALEALEARVKADLGGECALVPGAGAAGGLGYGLMAFAEASMSAGFDLVAEILALEEKVRAADLVLTGEGSIDLQTLEGKGPAGVAALARRHGCVVVAIGGRVVNDRRVYGAFDGVMPMVNQPMSLAEAMRDAGALLEAAAERAARILSLRSHFSQ